MEAIEAFYSRIPEHRDLTPGKLIPYFMYYCSELGFVTSKQIYQCFFDLNLAPYSNISSFLSSKSSGSGALFIKHKQGYTLRRHIREKIATELHDMLTLR